MFFFIYRRHRHRAKEKDLNPVTVLHQLVQRIFRHLNISNIQCRQRPHVGSFEVIKLMDVYFSMTWLYWFFYLRTMGKHVEYLPVLFRKNSINYFGQSLLHCKYRSIIPTASYFGDKSLE